MSNSIFNPYAKNKKREDQKRFKNISEAIHNVLIDNRCDALETELILNQMAASYAMAAKKAYVIYDNNKNKPIE